MKKLAAIKTSVQFLFGICAIVLLAGCQIHKPVPVEHLSNSHSASSGKLVYDARQTQRPSTRSVAYAPATTVQTPQWAPIDIQPLNTTIQEPTVPLKEYKFKPHPSATQRPKYTRPVAATSRYVAAGDAHIVKRGESLYGIARQYGMSAKQLAGHNDLRAPYEIYPNQKLYLSSTGRAVANTTRASQREPVYNRPTKVTSPVKKEVTSLQWAWPTSGKLIESFNVDAGSNGIEIAGEQGRTIRASADGSVLYSGNEVTGYGELIIIEHAQGYMTTYAHNRKLLVKQGDQVKRGQKIAEMGSSEADRTKLHFEIRKGEKPVNPIAYLPRR